MAYTNAVFFLDFTLGSDSARSGLASVSFTWNAGAGKMRATKTSHGLVTGAVVDITGTTGLNDAWKVTKIDDDTFDLDSSSNVADTSGTVTPRGGQSWADAWQTITSGATAARIAAGDTIKVAKSPDPVSIGDATWTDGDGNITLAAARTQNVEMCETTWTNSGGGSNATSTSRKQGSYAIQFTAPASPGTSTLHWYKDISTLDLSAYQYLSFWILNEVALATGNWKICLCSDNAGTTIVDTFQIPAIPSTTCFTYFTLARVGEGNLGSAIESIAIYSDTVAPTGSKYIRLDNIIATKTGDIHLGSLISKNPNAQGGQEAWYTIMKIDGTTVKIDLSNNTYDSQTTRYGLQATRPVTSITRSGSTATVTCVGHGIPSSGTYYAMIMGADQEEYNVKESLVQVTYVDADTFTFTVSGTPATPATGTIKCGISPETVTTYIRDCIHLPMVANTTDNVGTVLQKAGSEGSLITYEGGYNTSTGNCDGETFIRTQNCVGFGGIHFNSKAYNSVSKINPIGFFLNLHMCTFGSTFSCQTITNSWYNANLGCCYFGGGVTTGNLQGKRCTINITNIVNIGGCGIACELHNSTFNISHMSQAGSYGNIRAGGLDNVYNIGLSQWNGLYGLNCSSGRNNLIYGMRTRKNNAIGVGCSGYSLKMCSLKDCVINEATEFTQYTGSILPLGGCTSQNNDRTKGNDIIYSPGGLIIKEASAGHTVGSPAWKLSPTSTTYCPATNPLSLNIARVACVANKEVTVKAWAKRSNTGLTMTLKIAGGWIEGVASDVTDSVSEVADTWEELSISFTPTEQCVADIVIEAYGGTTYYGYVADMTISQAA